MSRRMNRKKEHLDPVPESDSDEACASTPARLPHRPRAHTTQSSEGGNLTVFMNGHHKPAHKHNQMAHKCGLPYVVPRAHSGPSPATLANRSVDNLLPISTIDALHSDSHIKDSMVSARQEQRQIKSEHNSPVLGSTNFDQLNSQLPPLDLSSVEAFPDYTFSGFFDGFPAMPDLDHSIFSGGLSATSVDWSHYDGLDFNDRFATSELSQAPSFTGFDYSSVDQPGLTMSTSGEISEVEDFGATSDPGRPLRPSLAKQQNGSDFDNSDFGDVDGYRLSTASSFMSLPQAQMLANHDSSSLDIEDFLKGVTTSDGYVRSDTTAIANGLSAANRNGSKAYLQPSLPYEVDSFGLSSLPMDDDGLWMDDLAANTMCVGREGGLEVHDLNLWAQ
ncbi:MAG: hypothetical protein M1818_006072 [Claussenomyces sp. TS43310]|nr:MAG: hypothetical protein M1818_006072 [Claussenomyces sp. TS43310]